ncbi:sensor histidine kinase [Cupriavidus pauculus]|nr:ATP-binding protein [Cupriavidus pauculus]
MTDIATDTGRGEASPAAAGAAVHRDAVRLVREIAQAMECRILSQASSGTRVPQIHATSIPNPWMDQLVHLSRVAALGTLAASIAHELRQPLTSIRVETYAMQRWINRAEPNVAEVAEGIQRIQASAERAEQVIRSLRALMRQEPPSYHSFQLDQAILDVLPLVEVRFHDTDIRLRLHLDAAVPPVHGDRVQVQQIVLNLLLNAIDALGIRPHGTGAKIDLHVGLTEHGLARIEVVDNGVGIDPGKLPHIFDLFVSTKQEGMGIGLAICRMIAEAHGGTIQAASGEGKTAFTVTLPLAQEKGA